ncbi:MULTISPECIES: type II toxin-antitoxin system YafQ family toxin [Rothia]|uniref:Addiction module toxin RelE n=1 Tax=Rothia nasimurium TaxID=85336 RepID=A0A1Y1RMC6_9MICC|nr:MULTISPECIES: type II toxin-antitoxin system YafQ family toxin [Rothia]ORC15591.1 addiction module toxin RelE [Rothia nasimurium]
MKYEIITTNAFKKGLKTAKKRGKDLQKLTGIVETLAQDKQLSAKHKDHALTGNYANTRECHIEPDWLLIYERIEDQLVLILLNTGSHSDLF